MPSVSEMMFADKLDEIEIQLASPLGAEAFVYDSLPDPNDVLGKILCQHANLKSDAEFALAVRSTLRSVISGIARLRADRTEPTDSMIEEAEYAE